MNTELIQKTQDIAISEENFVQLDPYLTQIGYFSVEEKGRIRALSKSLVVKLKGTAIRVELNALDKYDLPRTSDLDKYLAFAKILYSRIRRNGPLQNPISLLSQDLLREVKLKSRYNDYEYKSVKNWLGRLRSTEIICENTGDGDTELSLMTSVFHRIVLRGDRYENEVVKSNLIWMDDVLLTKFNQHEIMPLDYEGYKLLKKPTAKNLVPLLSKWLFSSRHQDRFEKNYEDLSDLLGTVRCHHKSDIKKQLFPGLGELKDNGWIEKFEIENNSKDSFKVCIKHGDRFKKILSYHELRKSFVVVPGNNIESDPSSDQTNSSTNLKLVEATEVTSRKTGKSKFSFDEWLIYAKTQSNLNNPTGFADKAYSTGDKDHILENLQAEQDKLKLKKPDLSVEELKIIIRFCPQCFGSGREIVAGKGARPCKHERLTNSILESAAGDGDLPAELLKRYQNRNTN